MLKKIDNFFERLDNSLVFNRTMSLITFIIGSFLLVDINLPNDVIEELLVEFSMNELMLGQFIFGYLSCLFFNCGVNFMIRCHEIKKDRNKEN